MIDNTIYWDGAEFARQVGLLPAQGSLADRLLLRAFNAQTFVRTLIGRGVDERHRFTQAAATRRRPRRRGRPDRRHGEQRAAAAYDP